MSTYSEAMNIYAKYWWLRTVSTMTTALIRKPLLKIKGNHSTMLFVKNTYSIHSVLSRSDIQSADSLT